MTRAHYARVSVSKFNQHGDLLAKSENLQGSIRAAPELDANDGL